MATKFTKRNRFEDIKAILNGDTVERTSIEDAIAFIDYELELLDRKNATRSSKPTAHQIASDQLCADILANMEENVLYTCSDMIKKFPCCAGLSTSKVSGTLRRMYDNPNPTVERVEDKRKTFFKKIV